MSDRVAELEARVRRMEDLEEIRQLFVDYGHCLDSGDAEAYANLFAREGEAIVGRGRAKGRAAIRAHAERMIAEMPVTVYHLVTNPMIDLDGDRATAEVLWLAVRSTAEDRLEVPMFGRHKDELIREDGRWKFLKRRGILNVPSTLR
jgi:uncharacterized protein (TIGR02246 family)